MHQFIAKIILSGEMASIDYQVMITGDIKQF